MGLSEYNKLVEIAIKYYKKVGQGDPDAEFLGNIESKLKIKERKLKEEEKRRETIEKKRKERLVRDLDIFNLHVQGKKNNDIAIQKNVSESTISRVIADFNTIMNKGREIEKHVDNKVPWSDIAKALDLTINKCIRDYEIYLKLPKSLNNNQVTNFEKSTVMSEK